MLDVGTRMTEVTLDLFKSMMGLPVEQGPLGALPDDPANTEIVAFVGLSGSTTGMLGFYSSARLARRMTAALLGSDPGDAEVRDGFGEIANIIAGNVATALGDVGENVQLSLPSVIDGQCLVTSIPRAIPPRQARRFTVEGEDLYIELALRRDGD